MSATESPHTAGIPSWRKTPKQRRRRRIRKTGGDCHLWEGSRTPEGYGRIKSEAGFIAAHRVVWQEHHGPIPDGLLVIHLCDQPPCVNPDHLALATHRGNMLDRNKKRRQASGERNGRWKGG